jgi:hypothetical protein
MRVSVRRSARGSVEEKVSVVHAFMGIVTDSGQKDQTGKAGRQAAIGLLR